MCSIMYPCALIFLCIFQIAKFEDCRISHAEEVWEKKLLDYLHTQPTTAPNETIAIYIHVILKSFIIRDDKETCEAASNIVISWTDYRLTWNPDEYQGISEIIYDSYLFWEPTIQLMNEVDYEEYYYHGLCRAYSNGVILCAPMINHEAPCLTKVSNWPYDVQNCTLRIGIFTPTASINLTHTPDITFLDGAENSEAWTIKKYYPEHVQVENQRSSCGKGTQIDLTFLLQREGAGLVAIIVYPSIALAILTFISFLFNVQDDMRQGIICFNLLCHFWFIKEISDLIPEHSKDTPTILFYLRESLFINMFLVMLTIFLSALNRKAKPTPSWINKLNDAVLNSKIRLFIWPCSKVEVVKKMSAEEHIIFSQWMDFSNILNSFCLWLLLFVYIYLICVYIPSKTFLEPDQLKYLNFEDLD